MQHSLYTLYMKLSNWNRQDETQPHESTVDDSTATKLPYKSHYFTGDRSNNTKTL